MTISNGVNRTIILASNSPRRKEILKNLGLSFVVVSPDIKEYSPYKTPHKIVTDIAAKKALRVSEKIGRKNALIISADTIVVLKGEIIGKPTSRRDAVRILSKLSGTKHKVYTGIAILEKRSGKLLSGYALSGVKMRRLTEGEIIGVSKKHLDKAGGYAVQEKSDAFVEKIEGDYFNVVGLPLKLLAAMLRKFGIAI